MPPIPRWLLAVLIVGSAVPIAGCTSESVESPTSGEISTAAGIVAGRFDVGEGREIYLECVGTGSPTVVLIGGLRAGADYWNKPGQPSPTVFEEVARLTRVCSYERPGTVWGDNRFSRSDPVAQPSSEESAVRDLHAVLTSADEPGPYVLVAHSYGGFIARMYAGTHPGEVAGLVLVDALSEGFRDALTVDDYAAWKETLAVPEEDLAEYPAIERMDVDAVMDEIRRVPALPDIPLVVLSADSTYGPRWQEMIDAGTLPPGTPPDLGNAIDVAQRASQSFQARLTPRAMHITETNSGHDIPIDNPILVVDSIAHVGGPGLRVGDEPK